MLVDRLKAARALLAEKGWTQGAYARDVHGAPVMFLAAKDNTVEPVCFCILGAIEYATRNCKSTDDYFMLAQALRRAVPNNTSLSAFNDNKHRTLEDVLAVFDRAISREEAAA